MRSVVRGRAAMMRAGILLAMGLIGLAGPAGASSLLDFVTLDGVDYIRWADEPGRALTAEDLGVEFATIGCSIGEDARGCSYGTDAAAAFMPAGTKMYAVRGHATEFRLAAVWRDRIFLYQAWRNPRARSGAALYALAGKVRAIDVQRGTPPSASGPARTASAADTETLVEMILGAPVGPPRGHPPGEPRYWLTFWLGDGTTLGRPFFPEAGELMGGLILPPEFRRVLERYTGD